MEAPRNARCLLVLLQVGHSGFFERRCTPVRDTVRELGDRGSLVVAGEPPLIALPVHLNMFHVLLTQLLERSFDGLVALATLLVEGKDAEVCVAAYQKTQ
jgi:hypothetical protein